MAIGAALIGGGVVLHVITGVIIAPIFAVGWASRLLPDPVPVSLGARVHLLPDAMILWPLIAAHWLRVRPLP